MATFAMRLRQLRKQEGLTQAQVAESMGVSAWTVSMWEKGPRKPEFETLDRLADFFHVKMAYLLGESDDDTAPAEPTDEETGRWLIEESVEELSDCIRQFLRLDYTSKEIVKATISTAYRLARASGELLPENWYEFTLRVREKGVTDNVTEKTGDREG